MRILTGPRVRQGFKRVLALPRSRRPASGTTVLIYHRVGAGSPDELDTPLASFASQVGVLRRHRVVSLDTAIEELESGDDSPKVVVTFDDGFASVYRHAWPLLRDARLPFTIYLATAYMGAPMVWEGATGTGSGTGLTWPQLEELVAGDLVTIGNHTHDHVLPSRLDEQQLDRCTRTIEERLGVTPRHFAYPWGEPVPRMEAALRLRFRSAVTGRVGRNRPGADLLHLNRVPVRATDPLTFFEAKLTGRLLPERVYTAAVGAAKRSVPAR